MDPRERRRIVLATAFTVVALPSLWLLDRDDPAGSPSVAAAGVPAPVASVDSPALDVEPDQPIFLEDNGPVQAPVIVAPATPVTTGPNVTTGRASFQEFGALGDTSCTALGVPLNTRITVVNLDNGLQLVCTNSISRSTPPNVIITIDTDLFATIADLSDAPVPVRIDW